MTRQDEREEGRESPSEQEQAWAATLAREPALRAYLALLLNSYRELAEMAMEGWSDPTDYRRSRTRKDGALKRLGIPLFESHEDWKAFYAHWKDL